jgi:5-methylcytosine-specific restriction endonuclease McrA
MTQKDAQEIKIKIQTKVCTKCGEEKALSEFRKRKRSKDGFASCCKKCAQRYDKSYYKENKEKVRIKNAKYQHENRERLNKKSKAWREKNKDYFSNYFRNVTEERKSYVREKVKQWSKNNPDKKRAKAQKRRAAKAGNGGSFTAEEWKALKKECGGVCLCCGKKKKLTVDHVIPVSKGGTSYISNIQPLCQSCNASKGNRSSTDYRPKHVIEKFGKARPAKARNQSRLLDAPAH